MRDFPDALAAPPDAVPSVSSDPLPWASATFRVLRSAAPGRPAILDCTCAPGFGPPVHALRDAAVSLVVTAGELEVWTSDRIVCLAEGQSVSVPAGAPLGFRAVGGTPSRHLHVVAGPDFEAFLRALAVPALPGRRRDFDAAAAHGLEFRGPPLGAY